MNILELCLSPAKGGLELYAYRCVTELSKTDSVITVIKKEGALEGLLKEKGIRHITQRVRFKPFPLISAFYLARVFSRNSIDIVHVHWVKDLPLVALAKKLSNKKPNIVFTRQMQITRNKKDFYHRFVYKEIDKFIAITKRVAVDLKTYLPDFCADKIETLYYGVPEPRFLLSIKEKKDLRKENGVSDKTFLIGLFGRIKKEKGQYLLINAVNRLVHGDQADVTAIIVGHPMKEEYLAALKDDVADKNLGDNIVFKGFIDNPQSLMQVCDVVVLTTYEETFGLVLAEAMRAGVAVIGSNSGGVPEIINHNEDGLLFKTKDSDDLYNCLNKLVNDREFVEEIAKNGKEKADKMFNDKEHFVKLRKILNG